MLREPNNTLSIDEMRAIKEAHPGYKWYHHRGTLLMKYGEGKHRDRVRKVNGRLEYKRHVHDSPAFTDMMGHPNFGKSFIRHDVLVFASVEDFCAGKDPIND